MKPQLTLTVMLITMTHLTLSKPTTRAPRNPTTVEESPEAIWDRLMGIKAKEDLAKKGIKGKDELDEEKKELKDDDYTYEYQTIEDEKDAKSAHKDHSKEHSSKDPRENRDSGKAAKTRWHPKQHTINREILDTLQKKERKGQRTSRERELAKRNLLRVSPRTTRKASASEEYVNAASFERIKAKEKIMNEKKTSVKKEYTYEYETVEKDKPDDYARLGQPRGGAKDGSGQDDEYTYEYQTLENQTKGEEDMTSKELFEKQLKEYHKQQEERHRRRNPDEYIDKVKVDGINIKEIKDDTNETLLNYDEHGNFRWRPELTHPVWKPPPSTTTEATPYLASDALEMNVPQSRQELPEYANSVEHSYSNFYDEKLQAKLRKLKKEREHRPRDPEVEDIFNMIDQIPQQTQRSYVTVYMTTEKISLIMDNFVKHMEAMATTNMAPLMQNFNKHMEALHNGTDVSSKRGAKRKTTPAIVTLAVRYGNLTTRSLAQRAERRERKLNYKRKLMDMKYRKEKHKNLFLEMRGFAKYTDAPFTESPGDVLREDSFDREYFYLKSERAFNKWLKYNKFRFPQLNAAKRDDYEVLLRCWDTDIKKARKGIPIVTLYPPPSTFEPSGETTVDYEYLGLPVPKTRVTYRFKDSLEEAFYRRYEVVKKNHTFESLEKIIQKREGPKYRSPQLDISEFNKKFWHVLLKEEQRDFEHLAAQKKRLHRLDDMKRQHRESIEAIASIYEKQRWIRQQIKKQLETKSTTIDRRVELDSEGREWFKGVRGITGDLPDEFYLDDKTDLPKHLRWRVDLPARAKKRKVEREKMREQELLEQGVLSTTSDPLEIYKRLFVPLEMPDWQDGLKTTTPPPTITHVTTETEHWFWSKYAKYFTDDSRQELVRAYEGYPKKYLTQWMSQYFPNHTDFYRLPDDYDPPEWQAKREEYIQNRRKKLKTTTTRDISSDEEWQTPYGSSEPFTYPTMTITWDWVGPNQTRYFGLLAKCKDKVKDRVVLDSSYIDQMWDKTDSKLERFDLPRFKCLKCNKTFMERNELMDHHKEHLRQEQLVYQRQVMNGSLTKKKKTIPPNKSYLFYYYSNADNVESDRGAGPFKPDYDSKIPGDDDYDESADEEEEEGKEKDE